MLQTKIFVADIPLHTKMLSPLETPIDMFTNTYRPRPWTANRGSRWVIVDAVGVGGFIPNALLMFQSKKTGDYHEEMDGDRFKKW